MLRIAKRLEGYILIGMYGVTVTLKWEVVQRLKELAVERNSSFAALAREAILEWLEKQEKGGEN